MALTFEYRQKIREELPYGAQSDIAKALNISRISVSKYFSGKTNSARIEKEAAKMYMKYKAELDTIKSVING